MRMCEVGREHQKGLEILHADKTPENLHPNTLQEMEVDIRNALGGLFKSGGGLEGVRQRCCDWGKEAWDRLEPAVKWRPSAGKSQSPLDPRLDLEHPA